MGLYMIPGYTADQATVLLALDALEWNRWYTVRTQRGHGSRVREIAEYTPPFMGVKHDGSPPRPMGRARVARALRELDSEGLVGSWRSWSQETRWVLYETGAALALASRPRGND